MPMKSMNIMNGLTCSPLSGAPGTSSAPFPAAGHGFQVLEGAHQSVAMRLTFPIPDLVQLQFPPRTRDRLGSPCDTQRGRVSGERGGSGGTAGERPGARRPGAGGGKGQRGQRGREGPSGSGGLSGMRRDAHLPQELIDGVFRLRRLADAVPEVAHGPLLPLEHFFSPFSSFPPFPSYVSAKGFLLPLVIRHELALPSQVQMGATVGRGAAATVGQRNVSRTTHGGEGLTSPLIFFLG